MKLKRTPQEAPAPKKKGLDVMIAVGPHKGKPGGGSPEDDLEGPGEVGSDPREGAELPEPGESQGEEDLENSGASLIQDLQDAGAQYGLDPETSKALAADFFEAMAKCLRGGEAEGMPMTGGMEGVAGAGGGGYRG